jgi:Protein of unknown function (DUF2892)
VKPNLGSIDRAIRIVAGLVLLSLVFALDSDARWFGLIGIVPLATGLLGSCPLYMLFGLTTCPMRHA